MVNNNGHSTLLFSHKPFNPNILCILSYDPFKLKLILSDYFTTVMFAEGFTHSTNLPLLLL